MLTTSTSTAKSRSTVAMCTVVIPTIILTGVICRFYAHVGLGDPHKVFGSISVRLMTTSRRKGSPLSRLTRTAFLSTRPRSEWCCNQKSESR